MKYSFLTLMTILSFMIVGCNSSNSDLELGNDQSSNRTYSVTYTLNEGTFTVEPQSLIDEEMLPYQLPLPTKESCL